jgi:hypothetical protein
VRALLSTLVLAAVLAIGCGNDGNDASACAPVRRDQLDPASARHLLPGAPEPDYLTEPPTSGAHASGRAPTGVLREPLSRPEQVSLLEGGSVLVQYRDLPASERRRLERLAGSRVTVGPNPDLPQPVVFTAWTVAQTCEGVDLDAAEAFIERFGGTAHNH